MSCTKGDFQPILDQDGTRFILVAGNSLSYSTRTKWKARVESYQVAGTFQKKYQVRVNVSGKSNQRAAPPSATSSLQKQEELRKIDRNAHKRFNRSMARLTAQATADAQVMHATRIPQRPSTTNSQRAGTRRRRQRPSTATNTNTGPSTTNSQRAGTRRRRQRPSTATNTNTGPSTTTSKSTGRRRRRQRPSTATNCTNSSLIRSTEFHARSRDLYGWTFQSNDHFISPLKAAFPFVPETFDLGTSWGKQLFLEAYMKTVARKVSRLYAKDSASCRTLHSATTIVTCLKSIWTELISSQNRTDPVPLESCPHIELLVARTLTNSHGCQESLEQANLYHLRQETQFILDKLLSLDPKSSLNIRQNSWIVKTVGGNGHRPGRQRMTKFDKGGRLMKNATRIIHQGSQYNCLVRRSIENPLTLKSLGSKISINVWAVVASQSHEVVLYAFETPYCSIQPLRKAHAPGLPSLKPFFCTAVQLCQHILKETKVTDQDAVSLFDNHFWPQLTNCIKMGLQRPTVQLYERSLCYFDFTFAVDSNFMVWLIKCTNSKNSIVVPSPSSLVSKLVFKASKSDIGQNGCWKEIARQNVASPSLDVHVKQAHVEIEWEWRSKLASVSIQKMARGYLVRRNYRSS